MTRSRVASIALLLTFPALLRADGPADNIPEQTRRVPKLGIEVPPSDRTAIEEGLAKLAKSLADLQQQQNAAIRVLIPDVAVYHKAVHDALVYQEFFDAKEIPIALDVLKAGQERADQLAAGNAPWTTASGPVVRGYISKIDGSVQPYGLVVPPSYTPTGARKYRVDIWFHGRGETLSELNFVQQRRTQAGQIAPADTIVIHPYGRYCNAFKFAGEVDVLEGLVALRGQYRCDEERTSVRGFSMGGAGCWQFAVHYPSLWFAANPGAGFAETPEFLKFFQKETLSPTWYEQKLWHMYDCTDWAANLFNCPTVAYSGENDIQKQAADIMEAALAKEGIDLVHLIGPKTAHSIHPQSAIEIEQRLGDLAEVGRQSLPKSIHFVTYTLKYNTAAWATIDELGEHWNRARLDGNIRENERVELKTENVTAFTLHMPAGRAPFDMTRPVQMAIDGQQLAGPRPMSDRSWLVRCYREGDKWTIGERKMDGLRKAHGLQGPIDDALMDSFIFVRPTGKPAHPRVGAWADAELNRAIEHWRRHFRGVARVKEDRQITDEDIASANLILWGDPSSNAVLAKIAERLPLRWKADTISIGSQVFSAADHAPVMIYPNPLNPRRYIVLNSSFTFRDFAYLNNARQVSKLPDWAIVDLRTPPDSLWPGKVVAADFFDERWQVKK